MITAAAFTHKDNVKAIVTMLTIITNYGNGRINKGYKNNANTCTDVTNDTDHHMYRHRTHNTNDANHHHFRHRTHNTNDANHHHFRHRSHNTE